MTGTFNKIDHPGCRMDCQRVRSEAGTRRDKDCHFASKIELPIRCSRGQRDHQIFQAITRMRSCTNSAFVK